MKEQVIPFLDWMEKSEAISRSEALLTNGYYFNQEGKIDFQYMIEWRGPWIHVKYANWHDCHFWSKVLFPNILQSRYVPSPCMDCYKVVVVPRTVVELLKLLDIMERLGHPSKCGTEGDRDNTDKLYGGYFYNHGLEEGRRRYKEVREWVDLCISPDVSVILKRGCTEYEQAVGPSNEWEIKQEQLKLEEAAKRSYNQILEQPNQPEDLKALIKSRWIKNAAKWGDQSYKEFTGGMPLFDPPVTYHDK